MGVGMWCRGAARYLFAGLALAGAAIAVILTWQRLFLGVDLQDESFSVVVPWRWALGDTPFVDEQNLTQVSSLLSFPFVKLFGMLQGYDVTGLMLYTRHVYLVMMIGVAAAVFLILRRVIRWELALPVASVFVTYLFRATPQLDFNTMGAALLTVGASLGLWVVLEGRGRVWAFASGVAYGLAIVAYPTLLFVAPFFAVFLAFAMGRRAVGVVADLAFLNPPDPQGPPTGRPAWRALSFWALGAVAVVAPMSLVILSFGLKNLQRCWAFTMDVARGLDHLGGAVKAYEVSLGFWRFYWSHPYLIVAALLIFIVYTRWHRAGRLLLAVLPVALWLAAQGSLRDSAGLVLVYAALAPYLFVFTPRSRRVVGAKVLIWVWGPAMIAGAMTAFTSADGYLTAGVGFTPALLAGGLFLAWSLEAATSPDAACSGVVNRVRLPWLALVVLLAVVGVTISFQFQFQQDGASRSGLTSRIDDGPWRGIRATAERREQLEGFATDLRTHSLPGDALLVFDRTSGYYLYWNGDIAANSYSLATADREAPLPQATISFYRRHRIVPTLVVRLIVTAGMTDEELQAACGGLGYPPTLVRPYYAFQRKPQDESVADVLQRLPRE